MCFFISWMKRDFTLYMKTKLLLNNRITIYQVDCKVVLSLLKKTSAQPALLTPTSYMKQLSSIYQMEVLIKSKKSQDEIVLTDRRNNLSSKNCAKGCTEKISHYLLHAREKTMF